MSTIQQQPGWVTTDALVHQVLPEHDAQAALLAAEEHHKQRRRFVDTVQGLRDRGRITAAETRAAQEIALIIAWTEGDMRPLVRSQFRERLASSTSGGNLWLAMIEAEQARYAPWKAYAEGYPVNRAGTSLAAFTRLLVVEGLGLRKAAVWASVWDRRALPLLRRSLHYYAAGAGWAEGEGPEPLA